MPTQPVIVFDVNETLLDLEALRPVFDRIFNDPAAMRLWFANLITYSEALTLADVYVPFTTIGGAVLHMLAATRAIAISDDATTEFTERFASMPPHPEVPAALRRLRDHGFRLFTLTDNTLEISGRQLERAGVIDMFERRFSVDETVRRHWGNVTRRPPNVTSAGLTLYCGRHQVEVLHPGYPAHTQGDLVAWLPEQRVLFTGDLIFNRVTPLVLMGSVDGAARALDWIAGLGAKHVIPGHGPLISAQELPGVLDSLRRYYRLIQDTARAGLNDGLTPLEAARRCPIGKLPDLPDAERVVLNLHRAYADAQGTEPDLIQAFTDAVAYQGGPLRTIV